MDTIISATLTAIRLRFPSIQVNNDRICSFLHSHKEKLKKLTCSVMIGTSIAQPVLSSRELGLKTLSRLTTVTYLLSTTTFTYIMRAELLKNHRYAISGVCILGTLAVFTPGISLSAFRPYFPLSVVLSILFIINVLPDIKKSLENLAEQVSAMMESNNMDPERGNSASLSQDSESLVGDSRDNVTSFLDELPLPLALSHLIYAEPYPLPNVQGYDPQANMDRDLEEALESEREPRPSTASYRSTDPFLDNPE